MPYNTELDSAFIHVSTWSSPYLTYIDYETLKTKGLDIIQNDSIKKGINYIYNYLSRPNDFEALKENDEFINILYNNIRFRMVE
ncbi:hypothetical protein [Xanthomarina spongicola]|uniref:Uncharacterized protein n=1 Tax=Xanthomarina spongicola TaxID=570520 RepID=A0A316DJ30_9FLAO|nr:hypothetical protein [Xanthomarina spongicola]PWK17502.1 hypothetical protein LX78_02604 [Xanthomarina spongicola]